MGPHYLHELVLVDDNPYESLPVKNRMALDTIRSL